MKLFGNKRHAEHVRHGLSGVHRGLILLAVSFVLLASSMLVFMHVWRDFSKPPEVPVSDFVPTRIEEQEVVDEETGETITVEVEVPASRVEGIYNILVVGTDDDGVRTDTIMIAHIDVNAGDVALLSVPRDTIITGNYTVPKINGVYGGAGGGEKGMEALKYKLSRLLGFEVDGYALVDLDAFIQLVDLVGGVDYDVPMDMDYDDPTQDLYIHLKKGPQHLTGEQAMQLVRFRKGYARQDIDRTATQQNFLKELAMKCIDELTIADIGGVAKIFKENVTTDLTLGNIAYFGENLLKCEFEDMFSYTLQGEAVMLRGASCWAIYLNDTLNVVNEHFNPFDTPITASHVEIVTPEDARAQQAIWLAEHPEENPEEDPEEDAEEDPEEDPEENPEEDPEEGEAEEDLPLIEDPFDDTEDLPEEDQEQMQGPDWEELPADELPEEELQEPEPEEFWPGR